MKHVYYYVFTCNSEDVEECINPLIPAFELYGDIKNIVINFFFAQKGPSL